MGEGSRTRWVDLLPGAGDPAGTEGCPGTQEGAWKSCEEEPETVGRLPTGRVTAGREEFLGEMLARSPQHE